MPEAEGGDAADRLRRVPIKWILFSESPGRSDFSTHDARRRRRGPVLAEVVFATTGHAGSSLGIWVHFWLVWGLHMHSLHAACAARTLPPPHPLGRYPRGQRNLDTHLRRKDSRGGRGVSCEPIQARRCAAGLGYHGRSATEFPPRSEADAWVAPRNRQTLLSRWLPSIDAP